MICYRHQIQSNKKVDRYLEDGSGVWRGGIEEEILRYFRVVESEHDRVGFHGSHTCEGLKYFTRNNFQNET